MNIMELFPKTDLTLALTGDSKVYAVSELYL